MTEPKQAWADGPELPVRIERVVHGGWGLARLPTGRVVLVDGVLPGELVVLQAQGRKKGVDWARALRILEVSERRVPPSCPHQELCGGCHLRHAGPSYSWTLKQESCVEVLSRARVLPEVRPELWAGPIREGWRCRVRYHALQKEGEPPAFGFMIRRSNRVVPIQRCPQAHPRAEVLREELQAWFRRRSWVFRPESLLIEVSPEAQHGPLVTLVGRGSRHDSQVLLDTLAPALPKVAGWHIGPGREFRQRGRRSVEIPLPDPRAREGEGAPATLSHEVPSGSFFQANLEGNVALIRSVLDFVAAGPEQTVLELFSGAGNFTLPLAASGARVTAVEGDAAAVFACRKNLSRAGLRARTQRRDLRQGLPSRLRRRRAFDRIVLDPPRGGVRRFVSELADLEAPSVVYVSCDPPALARDLASFAKRGYRVTRWRMLDLFPQTYHLEVVVLLERQG